MLDTPNLAYFKYGNLVIAGHPLENLKSMNSAFIQSAFSNFRNYATALFRGISNVHSLVLTYNSLKICDYYREQSSCEYADLLINVKWSSSMDKGLEILLSSSPELEKLACHQEVLSKLPEKVVYCLLSKLKVMEILGFRNDKDVIEKAKYILKNVGALQKLTIRTLSNISKAKKLKMLEVLLGSPRESKHCCILIV
ncbi:F-box/LRR-repeat protein At3g59250-like [Gossypium raimondii]|uniref:F-box/LRR-repeat protein At3g59250-like n=1 Tax=Gossypium raimondii TaxID=29730 RepID=UPI00063ABE84|nr:F-box/LRR-repeat protein At3g59250-like [Gossypium raimondii]